MDRPPGARARAVPFGTAYEVQYVTPEETVPAVLGGEFAGAVTWRDDAYIARKAEIDTMLTRLKALSDEHFNVAPDAVTWGDVGTLAHYAEVLKRLTDSAFKEGEHAE